MQQLPSSGRITHESTVGKTMLAKAVATEARANFIATSIPTLVRPEVRASTSCCCKPFASILNALRPAGW